MRNLAIKRLVSPGRSVGLAPREYRRKCALLQSSTGEWLRAGICVLAAWRKVVDPDGIGSFEKPALRRLRLDARHCQDVQQDHGQSGSHVLLRHTVG